MNRLWMISIVLFGCMVVISQNIRLTFGDLTSSNLEHLFDMPTVTKSPSAALRRRITSEFHSFSFIFYSEESLHKERTLYREDDSDILPAMQELLDGANAALTAGPWTVTDKHTSSLAPTANSHDYFMPDPYYFPKKDETGQKVYGAPYVYRFPEKIAGADLYSPDSEKYDRTRLHSMQYNSTFLGLAYFLTGEEAYALRLVQNIQVWFLNEETRMTPSLQFANLRRNHEPPTSPLGIQHFTDIYFFLDCVQMVRSYFEDAEWNKLLLWFKSYLNFMESAEIKTVSNLKNHDAVLYDIQHFAIANFLQDYDRKIKIWERSLKRLEQQIDASEGALTEELERKDCEHYQMLTLQAWWTMARLVFLGLGGETLWTAHDGALCKASSYAIPYLTTREPCPGNAVQENDQRWWPVVVDALRHCPSLQGKRLRWKSWMTETSKDIPVNIYNMPRFYQSDRDGVAPFWNFGMLQDFHAIKSHPEAKTFDKTSSRKFVIPSKLAKAAKDDADFSLRVHRIQRWHELGQTKIAEKLLKKALKDLRSTKVLHQPKDYIPDMMKEAAKADPVLNERIKRIRRWNDLGRKEIVQRMVQKSMDDLTGISAEENTPYTGQFYQGEEVAVETATKAAVAAINQIQVMDSIDSQHSDATFGNESGSEQDGDPLPPSPLVQKLVKSVENEFAETPAATEAAPVMEIPEKFFKQAETDTEMAKRIRRIQRWKALKQYDIANKMIKKMIASTEDQLF